MGHLEQGLSDRQRQVLALLDRIELEMKRIGYWSEAPSDLRDRYQDGTFRSYLDAPSFESWLQHVFIVNARTAAITDSLPTDSQVGVMAMRQYDYHSSVEKAHPLMQLLCDFDSAVKLHAS